MLDTPTDMGSWVPLKQSRTLSGAGAQALAACGVLAVVALGAALWVYPNQQPMVAVLAQTAEPTGLELFIEYFGARAYSNPQIAANVSAGMGNGVTFTQPVDPAMLAFGARVMLLLAAAGGPAGISESAIESQRAAFDGIATSTGSFYWNLMPEWDQSGGAWVPQGRPRYTGLTRAAARQRLMDYYRQNYPRLVEYLNQPASARKYRLAGLTDYSANVHYGYDFGLELQMLERGSDELGDIATGIAFLRGAARQYGRLWGVDLSSWRAATERATTYTDANVLTGGWSASYLRRHLYWAYMAGANVVHMEAAVYRKTNGDLNPLGAALQEFGTFALQRHPDVGKPVTPAAILLHHDHGFDTKHGIYNQGDSVWYGDIPYNAGDSQVNNLLRVAYPDHWQHGLALGAPFADLQGVPNAAQFRSFLAAGGDPRPYEPMPVTRWGDTFDVITNQAPPAVLDRYKLIVLGGDVTFDATLRNAIDSWVARGGVLVLFGGQTAAADSDLSGIVPGDDEPHLGVSSQWKPDGAVNDDAPFRYVPVRVEDADVLAVTDRGEPLITRRRRGTGEVYVVTALFGQNEGRSSLVAAGVDLMDQLMPRYLPAAVEGKPIQFGVNQGSGRTLVTLINNTGREWVGTVRFDSTDPAATASEYITGSAVGFTQQGATAAVAARVPAYDVRIYVLDTALKAAQ